MIMKIAACLAALLIATSVFGEGEQPQNSHFAAEVRYHFRDRPSDGSDEGGVSAPAHESEALPAAVHKRGTAQNSSEIRGQVKHLPFLFVISITEKSSNEKTSFDVKLLDKNGKEAAGFPKHITGKTMDADDGISVEISVDDRWRSQIARDLLSKDSFLTYISLVVRRSDEEK